MQAAGNPNSSSDNLDSREVERFAAISSKWWDKEGEFRPLHQIGAARLSFIREAVSDHFGTDPRKIRALDGLKVLDVGCGGGLISEPLARLGGTVTGIDPGEENIAVAEAHAAQQGLQIAYRATRVEDLVAAGERFDVTVCLEVIEHVPDPQAFVRSCAETVRPGGLLIMSTINRTLKAFGLAIVAAEHLLRWLPPGTHQWERFVTAEELKTAMEACGLGPPRMAGLVYDPMRDRWGVGSDTDVNYIAAAARPE
ncbi:MAG: bifunctional 2-polyprenyl-6-hydroxyphenol methylase/3-demethylubiquinol 3-O-methyltransferase UbiG [Alphaproteobacteria bacterium]|nr:bifunctional 2-polyprenyl-6-hydroxyphenol methylase/3-demethylubiquinol 3-O-methyltransferase UbiG [Alphaproteobacteria bacterium]